MPSKKPHATHVFINCPFDDEYRGLLHAIIFAVAYCGFMPRCAWELADGGDARFFGILRIISECNYGIHDLSRSQFKPPGDIYARFNMPFELGLFVGNRYFPTKKKRPCLILHTNKYEHQRVISDIAGSDISCHNDNWEEAVAQVRNFFKRNNSSKYIPGSNTIVEEYMTFDVYLEKMCIDDGHNKKELEFVDYLEYVRAWIAASP